MKVENNIKEEILNIIEEYFAPIYDDPKGGLIEFNTWTRLGINMIHSIEYNDYEELINELIELPKHFDLKEEVKLYIDAVPFSVVDLVNDLVEYEQELIRFSEKMQSWGKLFKEISDRVDKAYSEFGGKEILKPEYDEMVKELNIPAKKKGHYLKRVTEINERLKGFGYMVESNINKKRGEHRNKMIYKITKLTK